MKLPRWHQGSKADVAAFDAACRALWDNPDREETERYHRLNGRVNDLYPTVSRWQRTAWATGARLDRADRRERHAQARSRSRRRSR